MQELTPREITPQITQFCQSIAPSLPQYIPVCPAPISKKNDCFNNIPRYIKENGGSMTTGWAIWQRANILLHAEAHAIWKSPEGALLDITPHEYNDQKILFLEDTKVCYSGVVIPSIYKPLTSSALVKEFIDLLNIRNELTQNVINNTYSIPVPLQNRLIELNQIFLRPAERNDPCPCGSGQKYKRCCGKYLK